jgi:NADH dehydrogenase
VIASPLGKHLQVPVDSAGRVFVNEDLSIPDYPHVFVAGDLAATVWRKKAAPSQDPRISYVPGMAPGAMQEGRHAARNIMCLIGKQKTKPFEYVNKGSLATIGRASAVADLGFLKISGFPAWVAWLTVHIFYLIGFRNRLLVLIQWAWSYFTFQRGTRLITGTKR